MGLVCEEGENQHLCVRKVRGGGSKLRGGAAKQLLLARLKRGLKSELRRRKVSRVAG